jgi:hypothetical protein
MMAMSSLQTLRNAHRITRFVLVWFALFIGVAVASPWVKPQSSQMVCSAMGDMKLVTVDAAGDDVGAPVAHTALDCPACLPLNAPPVADLLAPVPTGSLSHVLHPMPAALLASLLGQPWQARAPPSFFA